MENLEHFFNSIIESLPDMVFVKDAEELRFVLFNKAGEELLGFDRKEMIGKNDYDFFPKEQADFFTKKDREVLAGGVVVEIDQEEIETKQGKRILHTKKVPLIDEHGRVAYLLGISEDITEKMHQAAELKRKLEELEEANKLMVNRELKMIELKKEIEQLKGLNSGS